MTDERYTTAEKVRLMLRLGSAFSTSTNPTIETVEMLIDQKMQEIDTLTRTSFIEQQSTEELDVRGYYHYQTGVKVYLGNTNIILSGGGLSPEFGDSLEVWNGSSYDNFITGKTVGRANNYWFDGDLGVLQLKSGYFPSYRKVKITYRHNKGANTKVNDASGVTDTATGTLTVDSTKNFPYKGSFIISGEEVRYNSKTATTFNMTERGAYGTTASAQEDDKELFWVPKDIEEACTKLVAIDLMVMNDYCIGGTSIPDIGSNQVANQQKVELWRKDVERILGYYQSPILALRK